MIIITEKNGQKKKVKCEVSRLTHENALPYYCINVLEDGKSAGDIEFSINKVLNQCCVANLSVYEEYKGKGYGRALLMAMEAVASENSVTNVNGYYTGNNAAENLYKSMGYRFSTRFEKGYELPWIANQVPRRRFDQVEFEEQDLKVLGLKKREK